MTYDTFDLQFALIATATGQPRRTDLSTTRFGTNLMVSNMAAVMQAIVDNFSWVSVFVVAALSIGLYIYMEWRDLPPGPVGIPYIGYYPFLKEDFTSHLGELSKRYGEVFCLRVTGQLYIHLSSLRSVKEVYIAKSDCFSNRPTSYSVSKELFDDSVGLLNGEPWKVLKKFFVQTLKEFGMGKEGVETVILDRVKHTISLLKKSEGEKIETVKLFSPSSNFVISHLLFSGSAISDEDASRLGKAYEDSMTFIAGKGVLLSGPLTRYILSSIVPAYKRTIKNTEIMESIFNKVIKEHEETFEKENLRDLVDYYLNERRILQERGDPRAKMYTDRSLVRTLLQFYGDGSLAVGALISAVIAVLAEHPDVQRKIQAEIDQVIGPDRMPSWTDRVRLPYTSAAIYEAYRYVKFIPLFPSLECTRETTILGHRIPKGAVVLSNAWSIHRDPELYQNQETFEPMRYISTGPKDTKAEMPIMFGVGKRSCPGESLSNMQVLLFVAAILQTFDLHLPHSDPSTKPKTLLDEGQSYIMFALRNTGTN